MNKGFTLIELMIVVAVIGILACIAIPGFLEFQCRAAWYESSYSEEVAVSKCDENFRARPVQRGPLVKCPHHRAQRERGSTNG